jgi:hypothetical protein
MKLRESCDYCGYRSWWWRFVPSATAPRGPYLWLCRDPDACRRRDAAVGR